MNESNQPNERGRSRVDASQWLDEFSMCMGHRWGVFRWSVHDIHRRQVARQGAN